MAAGNHEKKWARLAAFARHPKTITADPIPVPAAVIVDVDDRCRVLAMQRSKLLDACKLAFRHDHLCDDDIGSTELSSALSDALCETMGDEAFQAWIEEVSPWDDED